MKYATAIIMFSMCLFAILEPSYTIQCYECKAGDKGCFKDNLPSNFLKTCDINAHQCAIWVKQNAKNASLLDFIKRECLMDDQTDDCDNAQWCYSCAQNKCNTDAIVVRGP